MEASDCVRVSGRLRSAGVVMIFFSGFACVPDDAGPYAKATAVQEGEGIEWSGDLALDGGLGPPSEPSEAGLAAEADAPDASAAIDAGSVEPSPEPALEDGAQLREVEMPEQLNCGERVAVSVVMTNTGTTTWTRDSGYKLGSVGDDDPFRNRPRVWLEAGEHVPPGASHRFHFELQAPAEAGDYQTDWQMVQEHVHWFGDTAMQQVEVQCDAEGWSILHCARNGDEVCDDEMFRVPDGDVELGLRCDSARGGTGFIAAASGPVQEDGHRRCQGWEERGQNAWDHLDYLYRFVCDEDGLVLPVDLEARAGGPLWFGSHDDPSGRGHRPGFMTRICLVQRPARP